MGQYEVLSGAWPGVFEPGKRLPTSRVVPIDFDRFLIERCGHANAYVIRYLHQALPFNGGYKVSISTGRLARCLGVDPANLRRVQRDVRFLTLVDFMPGVGRVAGAPGICGLYDLRPLFAAYRGWRDRSQGDRGQDDTEVEGTATTRSRRPGDRGHGDLGIGVTVTAPIEVALTTLQHSNNAQINTQINTDGRNGVEMALVDSVAGSGKATASSRSKQRQRKPDTASHTPWATANRNLTEAAAERVRNGWGYAPASAETRGDVIDAIAAYSSCQEDLTAILASTYIFKAKRMTYSEEVQTTTRYNVSTFISEHLGRYLDGVDLAIWTEPTSSPVIDPTQTAADIFASLTDFKKGA